jgi:AcrR family transcriptional regulator
MIFMGVPEGTSSPGCPESLPQGDVPSLLINLPVGKISERAQGVNSWRRYGDMPKKQNESQAHRKAFASRRRDPATKREAILKTAAELFIEKSYSRTSLNEVAERLNITKPALYTYFRNKEEILLGCYRWGTALIEESLNQIAREGSTGLEKVEAFVYSYAQVMTVNLGRCVMRLDEGDLSNEAVSEVRNYKRKIDRRLRSFIQEGIEDGSIALCDPKIAAFAIAGAVNWICMWYEPRGPLTAEEIASQFARTLTQGLAAGMQQNAVRSNRTRTAAD